MPHAEVYLLLAILSSACVTIVLKVFDTQHGNRFAIILGNYLTCVVVALIRIPEHRILLSVNSKTLALGLFSGVLFVAGLVSMQSSIRINSAALTAAFAKLGLIVPLAAGILLFGERPDAVQTAGILLVFAAIFLLNRFERKTGHSGPSSKVHTLPLLLVLLTCGGSDAMAKVFEHVGERQQDPVFFLYLFASAAVLTTGLMFHEYKKSGKPPYLREFAAGIAVGIPNFFSSAFLLKALLGLPAYIVYPCFSTGTILLILPVSIIFFHERFDRRTAAGLLVILAALVLLNLS